MRAKCCGSWSYGWRIKPGAGAKPQPGPRAQTMHIFKFKYILKHIYNKNNVWCVVGWPLPKALPPCGGGLGFDPHGLHKIFTPTTTGCHVAAHAWATWHHPICQKPCHVSKPIHPCVCQLNAFPRHIFTLPHHHLPCPHATSVVRPCHVITCTDCTVNNFFACLANRTERDISLIRCLFDPVRSALGS
jgi:hypothetical protein